MAEESEPVRGEEKYWDDLWVDGVAPGQCFDREAPIPALVSLLSSADWMPVGTGSALVPGMGRGYDLEAIARSDKYAHVVGMDISPECCRVAREYLDSTVTSTGRSIHEVVAADFLAHTATDPGYDLVIDYTFLCALELKCRKLWGEKMGELIKPGGSLLTFMYPMCKKPEDGGPPFGVSFETFPELLEPNGFKAVDGPRMLPDEECHLNRVGRTGFARWVKQ